MGFFDLIFGKKKDAAAATQPAREIGLADAGSEIESKLDEKMKPFSHAAESDIREMISGLKEMESIEGEFSRKPVKTENPDHQKIAKQMKENYFQRITKILHEIGAPEKYDYGSVREFHAGLIKSLNQITKITSDNRYMLFFFKEEFERMGEPVKKVSEKADSLAKLIDENSDANNNAEELRKIILEIGGAMDAERKNKEAAAEIENRVQEQSLQIRPEIAREQKEQLEKLKAEEAEINSGLNVAKGGLASLILPLERLLRRYERATLSKTNALVARTYLDGHLEAARAEGFELAQLKAVCIEINAFLADGKLKEDDSDRKKHAALIEKIISGDAGNELRKILEFEQQVNEIEKRAESINSKLDSQEKHETEIRELKERSEKLRADSELQRKRASELKGSFDRKAAEFFGTKIELEL